MSLKFQELFDEIKSSQEDRITEDANKYYETVLELQTENYGFYEKNKIFFDSRHVKFEKQLQKFREHQQKLQENFSEFDKAFEQGNFIRSTFVKIKVDELYKIPETIKLPNWFEQFKEEEFEKVKAQLNAHASRLYRSKVTETLRSDRKKAEKRIDQLIIEIQDRYKEPSQIPIIKINELQHYIEELQGYDRVIPEICCEVMHKASEYARGVVTAFVEFRQKSTNSIQNII